MEIIDRYRQFRAISRRHNSGAFKCLSHEAFMEQARRLGIARGRTLILNTENELALVYDLALYARQGGRKRPLDRYAASQGLASDSDEKRVLDAMLAARFRAYSGGKASSGGGPDRERPHARGRVLAR